MLLKKIVYDKLVAKVNKIDTSDFVSKTKYHTDKSELENLTHFVQKAKLTEIKNKTPYISKLATETALTAVENKIHSFRNLINKIITQKLLKLKINLLAIIMTDILKLQSLIL